MVAADSEAQRRMAGDFSFVWHEASADICGAGLGVRCVGGGKLPMAAKRQGDRRFSQSPGFRVKTRLKFRSFADSSVTQEERSRKVPICDLVI
jgi:hypothetical protein